MRLVVVGAGYVGLATAVGFARQGHGVRLIERDPARLAALNDGIVPFADESLRSALPQALRDGLTVTRWEAERMAEADVAFICVDTPSGASGELDHSGVGAAAERAAADGGDVLVVLRSTLGPGTTLALAERLSASAPLARVAANPEFLREGSALADFEGPDRRVAGVLDDRSQRELEELYAFSTAPLLFTDPTSAELIKLGANAALAVRVSMANEVAALAAAYGVDPRGVLAAIGADPRIGAEYLRPGLGYGGHCLPKDLAGFVAAARAAGVPSHVLGGAAATNGEVIERLAEQAVEAGRSVCVVGLGFKPGSDSTRGSRALALIEALVARGMEVAAFDPAVAPGSLGDLDERVVLERSIDDALRHDVVIVTQDALLDGVDTVDGPFVLDALGRRRGPGPTAARNAERRSA